MQRPRAIPDLQLVFHPETDAGYRHFDGHEAVAFDAGAATVTRANAWWLAEAALLAYWDPDEARRALRRRRPGGRARRARRHAGVRRLDAGRRHRHVPRHRAGPARGCVRRCPFRPAAVDARLGARRVPERARAGVDAARREADPAGSVARGLVQRAQPRRGARHPRRRPLPDDLWRLHVRVASRRRSRVRGRLRRAIRRARRPLRQRRGHRHARTDARFRSPTRTSANCGRSRPTAASPVRRPRWRTSSGTSSAASAPCRTSSRRCSRASMRRAPDFLLDHMPRGYAVDIWNDHDAHG